MGAGGFGWGQGDAPQASILRAPPLNTKVGKDKIPSGSRSGRVRSLPARPVGLRRPCDTGADAPAAA